MEFIRTKYSYCAEYFIDETPITHAQVMEIIVKTPEHEIVRYQFILDVMKNIDVEKARELVKWYLLSPHSYERIGNLICAIARTQYFESYSQLIAGTVAKVEFIGDKLPMYEIYEFWKLMYCRGKPVIFNSDAEYMFSLRYENEKIREEMNAIREEMDQLRQDASGYTRSNTPTGSQISW